MASSLASAREYDNFFQTSDTLATTERRAVKSNNSYGRPVRLPSKLSAIALDPLSRSSSGLAGRVYVAGSDACVRRVRLPEKSGGENGDEGGVDLILGGPTAPLTCLEVLHTGDDEVTVFAGCWDKAIYSWVIKAGKQLGKVKTFAKGHSDFVKCIALHRLARPDGAGTALVLVSGAADKSLIFWDGESGHRVAQLNNFHKTSFNAVVIDPAAAPDATGNTFTVVSTSSDGDIAETEFAIRPAANASVPFSVESTGMKGQLQAHPTTVYDLVFFGEDLDLLTASADGTTAVLKRNEQRFGPWEVEARLKHEGHVRCAAADAAGLKIFTGGRDENVKLWDSSTGKVVTVFDGHFDEVTGLVVDGQHRLTRVISVSLDGTVRTWDEDEAERIRKGAQETVDSTTAQQSVMTAEEEAELEALMEDSD